MKKLGTIGLLVVSLAFAMPQMASAAPVPTVTVTPLVVAPGGTLTISVDPNGGKVGRFYWFTKGGSETAIASWGFGCYQFCFFPVTSTYTIPLTWKSGSNYYVKIYDAANDNYIKTNFTVKR